MNEEPSQPGEISGDMDLADLRNRCGAPDRGEATFIHIMELFARRVLKIACNGFRNGASLLHGDWGNSREQIALGILQRCEIADDKDFGMLQDAEIAIHRDAASTISWNSELLAQRRSCDSSGPQDYRGRNSLFANPNCSRSN